MASSDAPSNSKLDMSQLVASAAAPTSEGNVATMSQTNEIRSSPFARFGGRRRAAGDGKNNNVGGRIIPASARSFLRKKGKALDVDTTNLTPGSSTDDIVGSPSAELLEAVVEPVVAEDLWDRLTGREFDFPGTVAAMARTGLSMCRRSNREWVEWKPADKITTKVESGDLVEDEVLRDGDVLVYKGNFQKDGYGSKLPVVKTRSILPLAPVELAELLMDSSRVKTYNAMSLGRDDVKVMQKGINTVDGDFGDGETKIVRNLTDPPVTKKKFVCVTMMHARALRPEQDKVDRGGYLVVSRAVAGDMWESDDDSLTRNEILLGVNLIQESLSANPNECVVTSVTHVYSPSVPVMLAGSVGVKGAVDFIKDIRKLG
eukprot:CAMPEP_0195297726 /NCGR_PEP_ID=MMETSP0707-20130614/22075_1 /TAXON_ID=33640 /ORGANISM="Asterionellopsis glacialis, Strain CCMP134" /LENGTH=373 /DNA_ID=CAMNT_0040359625 /DNA_START=278 /DNA_END=1395 /DNA_ORIENTATION=-